tara:strand:+ start:2355 stop:2912 length:558 start_codon:yes stop_codon:yes gene_type:complete
MFKGHFASGVILGAGAAVNVSCGFIPDLVILNNANGATETVTIGGGFAVVKFDSGSTEIVVGDKLVDESAAGTFYVKSVTVTSGTWAGGDAAGWMEIYFVSGTVTNNNTLGIVKREGRAAVTNAATVDGSILYPNVDIDTEVGAASAFVLPYAGVAATTPRGFTIGASAAVSGEFVWWAAFGKEE